MKIIVIGSPEALPPELAENPDVLLLDPASMPPEVMAMLDEVSGGMISAEGPLEDWAGEEEREHGMRGGRGDDDEEDESGAGDDDEERSGEGDDDEEERSGAGYGGDEEEEGMRQRSGEGDDEGKDKDKDKSAERGKGGRAGRNGRGGPVPALVTWARSGAGFGR